MKMKPIKIRKLSTASPLEELLYRIVIKIMHATIVVLGSSKQKQVQASPPKNKFPSKNILRH